MQEDISGDLKKNGDVDFTDALEHSSNFLSYVILPHAEEKTSNSLGNSSLREKGNDSDITEEERSHYKVTEQQSVAVNTEKGLEKQSFATNHDQNNLSDEHKVNGCSKQGCHISQNPLDEWALNESLQTNCQHISIDCMDTDGDCVVSISAMEDTENSNENAQREHCQEDSDTITSTSDMDFDPQICGNTGPLKSKHVVITVTRTGPALEELEQISDKAEEEETRDANSETPNSPPHPHSLKDNLPEMTIKSATNNPPPDSTFSRATFSPSSPADKQIQVPALFSSLRVLRKGVTGPEHDTMAHIKPSPVGGRGEDFTEKQKDTKVPGSILDQISHFLSQEKRGDEKEVLEAEGDRNETRVNGSEDSQEREKKEPETNKNTEVSESCELTKPSMSSAEAAFDAFKAFFTPKPLKKDPGDKVGLEALRKKIRNDKDVLKTLFERASSKTPEKDPPDDKSETSSPGEGEERTPGRLQAVWPPLKEEKVGLKYTEAEHQAALLQLKRECKEELEKLKDYDQELSRLRLEKDENVARLEFSLAELQNKLSQVGTHCQGEHKDMAVSTADDFLHKSFRTVCIQTDRETFVKTAQDEEGSGRTCTCSQQQKVAPKKLDLASISKIEGTLSSSSSLVTPCSSKQPPPSNDPPLPPPPPPPPTPGLSLPPPPPALGLGVDKPPRKPAVEPSRPMKPLYWNRIQIQDNNNNTLWNILEEPNLIDASEFEDLFAKTTTQTKRKPLSETYEKKAKPKKIIKLLDGKRSQAVGILISSLHLEMKDIQQAVLTVDHSVVDLETIEALYENRGLPEELERIRKHYETSEEEDVKLLDKPEQFLYELSQIPDFAGRARCVIFQSAFIDGIASIQRKLNTVFHVCKALLESDSVRKVMGLVLALGNHMNGGSRIRGQADGFGLEILPKLKDVKSRDNRISLVDYVVSYYLHNVDKNAGTEKSMFPLPEPQDIFLAAQVKFVDLDRDLRHLGRDLTRCEKDVQKVCSDSPEEYLQPFKDKMEAFVLSGEELPFT
uniref:Formin-like n=1 Tax=Neolamprologus brichardi TaxID=32507 RepID=A0A3Q4G7X1_NEOBR